MAYEIAFRKRVIQYLEVGHSVSETGKLFGISVWTIRIWQKRQKAGCIEDSVRHRNFKKIDPIKLEEYVLEHPDAYLSELVEVFQCATSKASRSKDWSMESDSRESA